MSITVPPSHGVSCHPVVQNIGNNHNDYPYNQPTTMIELFTAQSRSQQTQYLSAAAHLRVISAFHRNTTEISH